MFEIDLEITVEAPGYAYEAFLEYVNEKLYPKYEGCLAPGIRSGNPYISCTIETSDERVAKAIYPILADLEAIGLKIKRIEICDVYALA